jgi:hypothetical protein
MARFSRKAVIIATSVVLVGAGTGVAFAFWTNTGSGTGTATTGTNSAITINQTSTASGLYPGGPAVTLSGDFTNNNSGNTFVSAVTATGYTIDAAHVSAGCSATGNYTLGGTAPVNADVPPGSHTGAWTGLTIVMNNTAANQDACKNAILTITYASN